MPALMPGDRVPPEIVHPAFQGFVGNQAAVEALTIQLRYAEATGARGLRTRGFVRPKEYRQDRAGAEGCKGTGCTGTVFKARLDWGTSTNWLTGCSGEPEKPGSQCRSKDARAA